MSCEVDALMFDDTYSLKKAVSDIEMVASEAKL